MQAWRFLLCVPLLSCVAVCWPLNTARADVVRMKNGDRLSGAVVSLAQGTLRLVTSYAGALSLMWDDVAWLTTDRPLLVLGTDDKQRIGWLGRSEAGEMVLLSNGDMHFFSPEEIIELQSLTEDQVQRAGNFVRPARWKKEAEAGAQVRSGNVETLDINLGGEIRRKTDTSELGVKVTTAFIDTAGERTAQQAFGAGRLDLLHSERLFSFYRVSLEHDALEELDFRARQETGLGYKVIHMPRTLLQGQIGAGVREEFFTNAGARFRPTGNLGVRWRQRIGARSELSADLTYLPDLTELGEYRLEADASFTAPITHNVLLRFSLLDRFNSDPRPGIKQNDLTLLSSVVWTF